MKENNLVGSFCKKCLRAQADGTYFTESNAHSQEEGPVLLYGAFAGARADPGHGAADVMAAPSDLPFYMR